MNQQDWLKWWHRAYEPGHTNNDRSPSMLHLGPPMARNRRMATA